LQAKPIEIDSEEMSKYKFGRVSKFPLSLWWKPLFVTTYLNLMIDRNKQRFCNSDSI
jgi:hypothetical protein